MGRPYHKRIYIAENVRTKEKIEGTSIEVAEKIGCSTKTVRVYGNKESIYNGYRIMFLELETPGQYNSLTEEDLDKWDNFIKTIHRAKKKQKGRFRKPQEII